MTKSNYITAQLLKLCPVSTDKAGQVKLKLHSELGETNWINISKDQLHQIETILCEGEVNEN